MAKPTKSSTSQKAREPTLRELSYATISADELAGVLEDAQDGPDRFAVIVTATVLESALTQLLLQKLRVNDRTVITSLYEGGGPLSNFSGKIKLGFVLNLYDDVTRDNLECIRRIRNAFAHSPLNLLFTTPQVIRECEKLYVPRSFPDEITSRQLYIRYCVEVMVKFNRRVAAYILRGQRRLQREVAKLDKAERPVTRVPRTVDKPA
ncbi:MAG: MltR family transcriptional regulator [Xanthobacteraceae bacterium]|nr:MltR family transcriptional regulator [Xanthobacteraceae bacterium]